MRILGLDTATRRASVGLLHEDKVIAEQVQEESRHAVSLLPLIEAVLHQGQCALPELDAIAVSCGPGSFTGLRVGLCVAKGMAWSTRARLVGVPTLEALARTLEGHNGTVCALLDARKGEVYAACFEVTNNIWKRLSDDVVTTPEALIASLPTPCTILGDGVRAYGSLLRDHLGSRVTILPWEAHGPRGAAVAALGLERLRAGLAADIADLEPSYVRPPEAVVRSGATT